MFCTNQPKWNQSRMKWKLCERKTHNQRLQRTKKPECYAEFALHIWTIDWTLKNENFCAFRCALNTFMHWCRHHYHRRRCSQFLFICTVGCFDLHFTIYMHSMISFCFEAVSLLLVAPPGLLLPDRVCVCVILLIDFSLHLFTNWKHSLKSHCFNMRHTHIDWWWWQ